MANVLETFKSYMDKSYMETTVYITHLSLRTALVGCHGNARGRNRYAVKF